MNNMNITAAQYIIVLVRLTGQKATAITMKAPPLMVLNSNHVIRSDDATPANRHYAELSCAKLMLEL